MSSQQQQQRVAEQQGIEHASGAERSRALAIPNGEVKLEQGGGAAGQGGQGEGALVPVMQPMEMEEPQINVRLSVSHLHCHECLLPLKPPTFKCEAAHAVCRSCRDSHAQVCAGAGAGAFVPCTMLDGIVRDAKVPCAYQTYGCTSWPVYFEAPEHHLSCRFAPCLCPVPGCWHAASAGMLVDHFASHHAWPVTELDYAKPCKVAVPGAQDKRVLVGKADRSVFLVSSSAFGASTVVSLVCVRACGDAAAGAPQYRCNLWAEVDDLAHARFAVASSDLSCGFPGTDEVMFLAVPRLLHGESGEPPALMVRIDKVGASIARSRSPAPATPPSSLPRRMLQ